MNILSSARGLIVFCAVGLSLAGCSFLKPSGITPRSFVLTPLPSAPASASTSASTATLGVGVGQVKVPGYLFKKAMVLRKETNEIVYLETAGWAEQVDAGLQRVLAANLGTLLLTERVRLSTWRREEVSVEVQVNVERFDVDARGEAVLTAWWRVVSPGGERILSSGKFSATRNSPSPDHDPRGAVNSMSALATDLSRELAKAIKSAGLP